MQPSSLGVGMGLILIVEDEPELLRDISEELAASGLVILTANHGREALQLVKTHHPHAILTDITMPNMTGLDLVQELRKQKIQTPCIIFTANPEKDFIIKALRLGVVDFIEKPFPFNILLEAVTRAVKLGMEIGQFEKNLEDTCKAKNIPTEKKEDFKKVELEKLLQKHRFPEKKSA